MAAPTKEVFQVRNGVSQLDGLHRILLPLCYVAELLQVFLHFFHHIKDFLF